MQSTPIPFQNLADTTKADAFAEKIHLSPPDIGLEEKIRVEEAIESNWVAPEGPFIVEFEKRLAKYFGKEHVLALNSGTSAIHLGLKLLGVEPEDFVIVPTFSFCAAVNPVLYLNANPVFVDCEESTWGLDPGLLEESILDCIKAFHKPKAIVLVHSYGMPAKIKEIVEISDKYDVPILEDGAESMGSLYNDRLVGSIGDISVLSFNGNKVLTTGGGGALILPDKKSYDKALKWATQSKEPTPYYHHEELGYNYRIGNVSAAIGVGQFAQLQQRIENKQRIHKSYNQILSEIPGLSFFINGPDCISNHWLSILLVDNDFIDKTNLQLCEELSKRNIEARPVWQPLHLQPLYKKYRNYVNGNAENLFSKGLCLPSGSALKDEQLDFITLAIKEILNK